MGAGTTDVAIFRYCRDLGKRDVAYYHAASCLLGADDIDLAIAGVLRDRCARRPEVSQALLAAVRAAKHEFSQEDGMKVLGRRLSAVEVHQGARSVVEGIFEHYRRTWARGYMKEPRGDRWHDLTVLLIGGGNGLPFVSFRFNGNPSQNHGGVIQRIELRRIDLPGDVSVVGQSRAEPVDRYAPLLTVAHGLAFHRGENPEYFTPHEVEALSPLKPPPPPREPGWER